MFYDWNNSSSSMVLFVMPPPLIGGGIKRWCCLTFVYLSDVCRLHRA